eukprot:10501894-Lingulodinium_polyedra.AAC.1
MAIRECGFEWNKGFTDDVVQGALGAWQAVVLGNDRCASARVCLRCSCARCCRFRNVPAF